LEAGQESETALASFGKLGYPQSECVVWAYRALQAAHRARELADEVARTRYPVERDFVRAEWLLGAALRARGELAQAEEHLDEALRRCRRINLVETEPDILLEMARLRHDQARKVPGTLEVPGTSAEALSLAREALSIADRCGYRLKQADCHNFLARLALEAGNLPEARQHAEIARERAACDGPPHRYEVAFQEAQRLLEEIEARA
jgi:tetratricopeptide (TPR) repeat protein